MTGVGSVSAQLWNVYMGLHDGVCNLHSLSHRLLYGHWRKLRWWVLPLVTALNILFHICFHSLLLYLL